MNGNMSLRQLSVGELLDKAFQIYRSQFLSLIGITAAAFIPGTILQVLAVVYLGDARIADLIQNGFITDMALVALIAAVSRAYLSTPVSIKEAYSLGLQKYWSVFGASFLIGLAIVIPVAIVAACIAFSVPGMVYVVAILAIPIFVFLFTRWSVRASGIVLEDLGASSGLSRSWNLTAKHFWRVLGTSTAAIVFVYLMAWIPATFVVGVSDALGIPALISIILRTLVSQMLIVFIMPLSTAVQVLIYYDLRIRVEGFDLAYKAEKLSMEISEEKQDE